MAGGRIVVVIRISSWETRRKSRRRGVVWEAAVLIALWRVIVDRTGVKCFSFFIWGGEQRLCRECEIHAGWSGQGKKSQKNRGRLSAPRAI